MNNRCSECPKLFHIFGACPLNKPSFQLNFEVVLNIFSILISMSAKALLGILAIKWYLSKTIKNVIYIVLFLGCHLLCLAIKKFINDPRPKESCSLGSGMPSNHVASVVSVLVYWYLNDPQPFVFVWFSKRLELIVWSIYILAVSFSRVYLGYHHIRQTLAGLIVGLMLGILTHVYAERVMKLKLN